MKETLKRFRAKFESFPIKTIEGNQIKGWLAQDPLAIKTRNRHIGYIKYLRHGTGTIVLYQRNPEISHINRSDRSLRYSAVTVSLAK